MANVIRKSLFLFLAVMLGVTLFFSNRTLGWTIDDPEIKDLSGSISVRNHKGSEEFSLQFVYLNERSMNYIWDSELVEVTKKMIGDRNCLFLMVFVKQDSYFYPTYINFVQKGLQYGIKYNDVIKRSDTFSGYLQTDVKGFGLVFIPESIDIYSPMKVYYGDDWTIFSVPKEEQKEPDIEEQIRRLEREKAELEQKIMEIEEELAKLRK